MDVHNKKIRSYNMSRIHGENTKPEVNLRKILWHMGYRYRKNDKNLPGRPDIVFPGRKKIIFVHGCFWHKHDCKYFKWPKTNVDFWTNKISENVRRDFKNYIELSKLGWECIVIWECELKNSEQKEKALKKIINFLES
ncbi:MAG: DNA mismatch endonuclease Vsr [Flexistipes sinusarabici]|uniref:Very short patch repair endonuclease n=1 Tax=Flexistipes sinusarabici TaxID=2352 RepID=A0A5D0MMD9_FLESI|nr:DNA mismatch endonuclease Vsr [Flexistipes sinusarabici]TYB32763.1 MAG: DNA mismatch endonuclease Vsr [Flexistipes sinusarabici]